MHTSSPRDRPPCPRLTRPPPLLRIPPSRAESLTTYDCDTSSFYSHASVVDVSDLLLPFPSPSSLPSLHLAPCTPYRSHKPSPCALPRPLADRVASATAEALDLKLSRATAMLSHLPLLSALLTPTEQSVTTWLLRAACALAAAFDASERLLGRAASCTALAPAQPPSDGVVRAVVQELRYTGVGAACGARYAGEWDVHARLKRLRVRAARVVVLPTSFAMALVGTVCALVRMECGVTRRVWGGVGNRGRGRVPQAVLIARCGWVRFVVVVVGTRPSQVVFRRPRFVGREGGEEFEGIVEECAEVVREFAEVVVYG